MEVVEIKEKLDSHGAMEYTVISAVPASASAALQYSAPFSGSHSTLGYSIL